jgi:hypothetical protein
VARRLVAMSRLSLSRWCDAAGLVGSGGERWRKAIRSVEQGTGGHPVSSLNAAAIRTGGFVPVYTRRRERRIGRCVAIARPGRDRLRLVRSIW